MYIRCHFFITCVVNFATANMFRECFQKDSISCLQMQLFNKAKACIDRPTIEIFSGIRLMKTEKSGGKSFEEKEIEESVRNAVDVESRQEALETYLKAIGETFWKERTLTWQPAETAMVLVNAIPDTVTNQIGNIVSQGRGKKKQMTMLMPLLMAMKLKIAAVSTLAFMLIAIIAKKAILAAAISLTLSGFNGIKSLTSTKPQVQATEVMGYQASSDSDPYYLQGGRFSAGYDGNLMTSRSEPAPQTQTLIGHKAS